MVGTATRDNPAEVIVDVAADVMNVDIGGLTDDELADHIVDIEQLRARMDGQLSVALARLENSRAYESDGAVTAKSWLKHHVRMTGPQAGARLKVARRLQRFDTILRALRDGRITFDQVRLMLARCTPMTESAFAADQTTLIDLARSVHIDDLAHALDVWAAYADPNGAEPEDSGIDSLHLNQSLHGRHTLQGDLNSVDGELLGRALERAEQQLGSTSHPYGWPLEPATRRAHALALIARHFLDCNESPQTSRPSITILTNPTDLALGLGARTDRGTWLTGDHVRRFLCDATIQAALTDEKGNLLRVYSLGQFPDAKLRRAIVARDLRCQFPGCDFPGNRCEVHHLRHRSSGGETTPENLALFCDRHHHLLHRYGWKAFRNDDGIVVVLDRHGDPVGPQRLWDVRYPDTS